MTKKHSSSAIVIGIFAILGVGIIQIPTMQQLAYAHTFSGDESADFIATVAKVRAELRLINSTILTNASQAIEHVRNAVRDFPANDTKEIAEKNQRIAADLSKNLSDLQNMTTANISPNMADTIMTIKQKSRDTDALLSEALSVRVEPDQLKNSTVYGLALANLLNETLEHYAEALGIGKSENSSTSATSTNNASMMVTMDNSSGMSSSNTATIVDFANYQSTQGLVNMTSELWSKTKSLANMTASTNAMSKVDSDITQLKSMVDGKASYLQVATLVYNIIYPDLNSALNLGLQKVDANKAIENAMSGEDETE